MSIYLRGYPGYCYELIFTDGGLRKKRIHLLINPNNEIHLTVSKDVDSTELNPKSLTHIVAVHSSENDEFLSRTFKVAELTNKPVISDQSTSEQLRLRGMSARQLRILGFEKQIIDGLEVYPVLTDEQKSKNDSEELKKENNEVEDSTEGPEEKSKFKLGLSPIISTVTKGVQTVTKGVQTVTKGVTKLGKFTIKPLTKFGNTILPTSKNEEIDLSRPHTLQFVFGKRIKVMIPINEFGLTQLETLIQKEKNYYVIYPDVNIDDTSTIKAKNNTLVVLNKDYTNEEPTVVTMRYNPTSDHNTIYAGYETWIEMDEFSF